MTKQLNFCGRWFVGFIVMIIPTALSSCFIGFMISGEVWQGLMMWVGEAVIFGLLVAVACPNADLFKE